MKKGKVKRFDGSKGYGFITVDDERGAPGEIFVHASQIAAGRKVSLPPGTAPGRNDGALRQDDEVEFEIGRGIKGPAAVNVRLLKRAVV